MDCLSPFLLQGAAGEPVGMDVARRRGDPVNKGLMSRNGILVSVDQFLQPVPAALGAVKVDHLEPVRPRASMSGCQPTGSSAMPLT